MGLLGTMSVRFAGDTSGLVSAVGGAKNALASLASNPMAAVATGIAAVGAVVVGVGVKSVQMASEYQRAMNMVQALTGANTSEMAKYDSGLKQLAISAGVAPKELANGLYYVMSAGYKGAEAMSVLKLSTEDAKIGMTDQTTTANALTTVLKSFGVQAGDVNRVNGEMLQTVTLGKMTMADYAGSIGKASSTSMQYHVSMEDMNASIATMTSNGIPSAHQAVTNFTQAVGVMYANINTVSKSLNKQGIEFNVTKFNTLDYQDKIKMLNSALEIAAEKHLKVTGVTKQAASAIQILSQHSSEFSADLASLSDKQAMGQKTAQAWAITQDGFGQTMDRVKAALDVVLISIGQKLLPILTQAGKALLPIIDSFGKMIASGNGLGGALDGLGGIVKSVWAYLQGDQFQGLIADFQTLGTQLLPIIIKAFQGIGSIASTVFSTIGPILTGMVIPAIDTVVFWLGQLLMAINQGNAQLSPFAQAIANVANWFVAWHTPLEVVAGLILAFFVPALIQAGIQALLSGAKIATGFVANMVKTGVEAVVNGAKVTVSFVKSIIQAGIEGWQSAGKLIPFIGSMIKSGAEAVINGAKVTVSFIGSMVKSGAEAVANGAKVAVSFVGSMIKAGAEAAINGGKVVGSFVASMATTGAQAVFNAAKVTASFVASMVQAGIQAAASATRIVATFVASLITTAAQAVATGATFVASLIPAIISFAAQALIAAATAIPAILAGFGAWIIGAAAVAIANIAAFWPIYLIVAGIILVIGLVVLAIKNWGAISKFVTQVWTTVKDWFIGFWNEIKKLFFEALAWLQNLIHTVGNWIYIHFIEPFQFIWAWIQVFFAMMKVGFYYDLAIIQSILQKAGQFIYNIFIKPFKDAWDFITGIMSNIGNLIKNTLANIGNVGSTIAHNLHIPGFSTGVHNFVGGLSVVGENGPELLELPSGSNVYPNGTVPSGINRSSVASNSNTTGGQQEIYVMMDSNTLAHVTASQQAKIVKIRMNNRAA